MTMKKITLFILLLAFTQFSIAQIINEPANWPNPDWTTSGNYGAAGLLADPVSDSSFSFDDDATGSTSDDDIASESPIIDLTPAYNGGENQIVILQILIFILMGILLIVAIQYIV